MKDLLTLGQYAIRLPGMPENCAIGGTFDVPCPATGSTVRVIASAVFGWDHVSVSHKKRCPNWPEMARIKGLFFHDDECAMQLHVPAADHVNNHPFCLHLWRPHDIEIPRPPQEFVGVPGLSIDQARGLSVADRRAFAVGAFDALVAREARRG